MAYEKQLELFKYMIPENRKDYTNVYEFLVNLPVFFFGHQDNDLYELNRPFIFNDVKYNLKIKRTRLSKEVDEFLTGKDQDLLYAILHLITTKETNATVTDEGRVKAKLSIYQIYKTLKGKLSYEDIKKGIAKLKSTQLEIIPETKTPTSIRWACETIIAQYMITDNRYNADNPDDITYIELSGAFSKAITMGKVKLMNFPVYLSLKNPISKYIYAQLTVFDFFSCKKERFYHKKSLFEFLANGGFMCDTTQNKNNTMYSFRKAMDELKRKGLIAGYRLEPKHEGKKIVDYKLVSLTPAYDFNKENLKQRKEIRTYKKKERSLLEYMRGS